MMRDDQGHEPAGGRYRGPEATPVDPLEHDPDEHCTPADEDGRGVEVRHWRPTLQGHASGEARRVHHRSRGQDAEGRSLQRQRLP